MKLKASLESVKSRKNVTDDIITTVTFHVHNVTASEVGLLHAIYKRPLEISIDIVDQTIGAKS